MNWPWHTRVLLALASGLALALSFPNFNFSLLAWISIGLLVLASFRAKPAVAPLYGFLHALVFYPVCLTWIDVVVRQYGDVPSLTAAGLLGLIAIAGGIILAIFSLGIALASRKSAALACMLAPCLWVTLEFARAHLPIIGFPWNLAGYAASGSLGLLQLTAVTGIYGLSFVVAAYGSLLAYAISGEAAGMEDVDRRDRRVDFVAGGIGYLSRRRRPRFVAHLVQTNFPQSYEYPPDWMRAHAAISISSSESASDRLTKEPGLIVWPEVPAPFSLQDAAFWLRAPSKSRTIPALTFWSASRTGNTTRPESSSQRTARCF